MTRTPPIALAVLLCGIVPQGARSQNWPPDINPKLKNGQFVIHKALILPPQITFDEVSMKGVAGMEDESDKLADLLQTMIGRELAARGVEVLTNPLETSANDEARYAVSNLQAKYDNIYAQLRRHSSQVKKARFTLGDSVAAFTPANGADVMLFVRGTAVKATKSKTAFSLLVGGMSRSHLSAEIAFADARTGEILAFTGMHRFGNMQDTIEVRLRKTIRDALKDIPLPVKPPKS